jgi:ribosomal protein S12
MPVPLHLYPFIPQKVKISSSPTQVSTNIRQSVTSGLKANQTQRKRDLDAASEDPDAHCSVVYTFQLAAKKAISALRQKKQVQLLNWDLQERETFEDTS